jgi:hypothetical protein
LHGPRRRSESVKRIEELAAKVSGLFLNHYEPTSNTAVINEVIRELDDLARKISGVRADQLSDEALEDKPIVRLYWVTRAELTAKVFVAAAQKQSYYREADL